MNTDWHIYPNAQDLEARWLSADKCPPWRRPYQLWSEREDRVAPVRRPFSGDEGARRDLERALHYTSSGLDEVTQVNLALLLRRPLLVRGVPGIGKSALAYHVAWKLDLGRPFRWEIRSTTTLQDGLYTYDAVGHFHRGKDAPIQDHIRLGPLGTVMAPTARPGCLLVDELDKASYDLPNDLLHVFEEGSFRIPELERGETIVQTLDGRDVKVTGGEVRCHHHPVIVITTNDEREFPPAFLRRCVELRLRIPGAEQIRKIVQAWFGGDDGLESVLAKLSGQPTDQLLQALFLSRVHQAPVDHINSDLVEDTGK
jgi:MoxR-like ATPase